MPRAAISPIFLPGGACLETVVVLRPPLLLLPYGCIAETMATPLVRGYLRPRALIR